MTTNPTRDDREACDRFLLLVAGLSPEESDRIVTQAAADRAAQSTKKAA